MGEVIDDLPSQPEPMFPAIKPPGVTAGEIHRRMQKMTQPQPVKAKKVCGERAYPLTASLLAFCQRPLGHSGKHSVRVEWGG